MRVLWFTNTPSCYHTGTNPYNGGGWISSAEKAIRERDDIELAVSFQMRGEPWRVERDGVTYYPLRGFRAPIVQKVVTRLVLSENLMRKEWKICMDEMLRVVEDFCPDIIHVFGTEDYFGLIASVTDVPVVLHIQGIITPYKNAILPPGVSRGMFVWQTVNPMRVLRRWIDFRIWRMKAIREQEIFRRVNHFIGRTVWDKRCMEVMHPGANYYYGGEILRDIFYIRVERKFPERLVIVSTISSPMYKGFDLALKTAWILKENLHLDFEWRMFGNINPLIGERLTGLHHQNVGIRLCGVATAEQLRDEIIQSTAYVHTSYIDNSPNSVCEAQILGVLVIVTHVGGTPSLIREGVTGFSVPANDPWQMAAVIAQIFHDRELNIKIGETAREVALKRHDHEMIIANLIDIYSKVLRKTY